MTPTQQMAEFIEKGLACSGVKEDHDEYVFPDHETGLCRCCVLGLALTGKLGNARAALQALEDKHFFNCCPKKRAPIFSLLLDLPEWLIRRVNYMHWYEDLSASEIVNLLRRPPTPA